MYRTYERREYVEYRQYSMFDEIGPFFRKHRIYQNYSNVGIIHTFWTRKNVQCDQRYTSTAFLISPTQLVTSTSAIYDLQTDQFCNKYFFIPGCLERDTIQVEVFPLRRQMVRSTIDTISKEERKRSEEFEFAVITLSKPVLLKKYFDITRAEKVNLYKNSEVTLIGYPKPTVNYQEKTGIVRLQTPRRELHGKVAELIVEGSILHHALPTDNGMAGSPILLNEGPNSSKVIGIHTAGAVSLGSMNSALYFSEKMFKTIKKLMKRKPERKRNPYDDE